MEVMKRGNNVEIVFMRLLISLAIISCLAVYSPNIFTSDYHDRKVDLQIPVQTEEKCDIFEGEWIQTGGNESLYSSNCAWISDWKNCFKHGRKDTEFVNWRWKPHACELPRFVVNKFFEIVRNKTMLFIGDSVARNQMESLLCMLSEVEVPTEVEKEDDQANYWTLYFSTYNFTITLIRSMFLVKSEEIMINGSSSGAFNINLDKLDDKWTERLPSADYAIISAAHWFFRKNYLYEKGNLIGCVHCSEPNVTNLGLGLAIGKAIRSALEYIHGCENCHSLMTILRTFSPSHFENGNWNSGGYCNKTGPIRSDTEIDLGGLEWELRNVQKAEIERAQKKESKSNTDQKVWILDVTMAMLMRPDGHPGLYCGNQWVTGINDCVHWCLPGPIDVWNDWLIALMKMEARSSIKL